MYALIKDGVIVRLATEIQVAAFKKKGWEDLGAVHEETTPKTPVNLSFETEVEPEKKESVVTTANKVPKTRKKPGRKPKA